MSEDDVLRALATKLGEPAYEFEPVTIRKGAIVSIEPPSTVTITLSGDTTPIPGVSFTRGYRPVVADVVLVLKQDSALTVLDTIASITPVDQTFSAVTTPLLRYVGTNTIQVFLGEGGLGIKGSATVGLFYDRATGFIYRHSSVGAPLGLPETWNNASMAGGWGSVDTVQYKLYPDGIVRLRGIGDAGGAITDGTAAFTLPSGFRPAVNILRTCVFDASVTHGRMLIRTNGRVEIYEAPNQYPSFGDVNIPVV